MSTNLAPRERRPLASLFRRSPFSLLREELGDWLSGANDASDDFFPLARAVPSVDLSETDKTVEIRADLPGMKAEEIDIQINGNVLTISGERKEAKEEKGETYHRVERRFGSFSRMVTLPCDVKEDKVEAKYHDGVLSLTIPKTEQARTRKIAVKPQ